MKKLIFFTILAGFAFFFNACSVGYVSEEPIYREYNRAPRPAMIIFGLKEDGLGIIEVITINKEMVIGRNKIMQIVIKKAIGKNLIVVTAGKKEDKYLF